MNEKKRIYGVETLLIIGPHAEGRVWIQGSRIFAWQPPFHPQPKRKK